jgi:hypothetical protein
MGSLRDVTPKQWWITIGAIAAGGALFFFVFSSWDFPFIIFLSIVGLLIYRRTRNRSRRLLTRFTHKIRKMDEVRVIARRDRQVTVVVDKAVAKTYVRINAAMDKINEKHFFGEPFTLSVRDDVSPDELRSLLHGNVLHVRDDVLDDKV